VHLEALATTGDLRTDPAQSEDQDRGPGEALVHHVLIEGPAADLVGPSGDVLRGREEEGHRVLRDGHIVRARVAAHDRAARESVERHVVHPRDEDLDHPEAGRPRGQIREQLRAEARADEDVRRFPGGPSLGRRDVLEDDGIEGARSLRRDDRASLRVHRGGEEDAGHRRPDGAAGLGPFYVGCSRFRCIMNAPHFSPSVTLLPFRFVYTGIRVSDMDESIRFYTQVLGMTLVERTKTAPTKGEVATLRSPGSEQELELNFYEEGSSFWAPYSNGEDLDHLAFEVENLVATVGDLRRKGVEIIIEPYSIGDWSESYIRDPNGIWIELLDK